MIKAIIFDFDGVLVSSELPRFQSIQSIAKKLGIHIPESAFKQIIGRTTHHFLDQILSVENKERIIDQIVIEHTQTYKTNITQYVEPISHSVEFIKNYVGAVVFAIGSMSSQATIRKLTNHFGIEEKFHVIVGKDDVTNYKPDPEVYLKAVEKLNVLKDECIVIEDTIIGAQAAINAGIKPYIILNGLNDKEEFDGMPIAGFISSQEDFENLV